jgi:hypothetical protein
MPYLGTFAKIAQADTFVLWDSVPMEDSGFENRVRIKTAQGPQWLTVPVRRSRDLPLHRVEVANEHAWQRKMARTVEMHYSKAPYFTTYWPQIKPILEARHEYLADLDVELLRYFMGQLGIYTPVVRCRDYVTPEGKNERIVEMCRQLGASAYVFGPQGTNYADVEMFRRAGIEARFQAFEHPEYPQLHGDFVEGLSVLDALLNCGTDVRKWLR